MRRKYRLLITRRALDALPTTSQSDQDRVVSFLNLLVSGGWEEENDQFDPVLTWKSSEKKRFIFSCSLSDHSFAVWEVLWTTDLAARLKVAEYGEREAPHHLSPHIVLYSIDQFPGEPDTVMHVLNEDFQLAGPVEASHLDFYERDRKDEVKYNEELFILAPNRIEDVLKGIQQGLPLHLTAEQAEILGTHRALRGPILMSGEAGSGKTSVITHWLLINQVEGVSPQLFVTFSPRLVERTKTEFEQTLPPGSERHGVRFLTYRDLLWEIANVGGLGRRDPKREMTFERFLREFGRQMSKSADPVLLWDEIRSVIKGGCLDVNKRMIDISSYEYLSEKRGQSKTPKGMRDFYYEQAQLYQNYLDKNGLWDGVDLAFDCLRCVDRTEKLERVACDEVQDLAPVEILVLIELVRDCNIDNIFFTGDMAQVINPSGFSWDGLKGFLGDFSKRRDIRDAWSLGQNFRSTSEIVELVNEMIRFRESILKDASGRNIQHSDVSSGLKPMLLVEDPMGELKEAISSPQQRLVLVKTNEQKESVRALLGDAWKRVTILTVEESKGLEWDGVLLWNFFVPRHEVVTKNDWDEIFIPKKRKNLAELIEQGRKNPYGLAYEFNLLHVGLTRARKALFVFDQNEGQSIASLADSVCDLMNRADLRVFRANWETTLSSPEELEMLALDLLEKDTDQAFRFLKLAAHGYERKSKLEGAARCYEMISEFKLAASCFEKAGNECQKERMLALDSREESAWSDAGHHWKKHGGIAQEMDDWRTAFDGFGFSATDFCKAAREEESVPKGKELFASAARMQEERSKSASRLTGATYLVARAESLDEAAECWLKAESYDNAQTSRQEAIAVGQETVKSGVAISIGGELPDAWVADTFARMAECEKKRGDLVKAAQLALKAGQSYSEAEKKAELPSEKENHLDNQNKWIQMAVEWLKRSGDTKAAVDTEKMLRKRWEDRKDHPRLMDVWEGLVKLLRESGKTDEYVDETSHLVEYLRANREKDRGYKVLEDQVEWCEENETPECLVRMLDKLQDSYGKDEEYYQVGGMLDRIGQLHLEDGAGREALSSFVEAGRNYLKQNFVGAALTSFERALQVAGSEMTPPEIGWTCFKDVTIDSLVPAKLKDHGKMWIETAIGYLVEEYNQSVSRIESYMQSQNEEIERVIVDSEAEKDEERKSTLGDRKNELRTQIGWILYGLGRLYQRGLEEGVAPVGHRQAMIDAYTSSIDSFKKTGNDYMVSTVEKMSKEAR